MKTYRNFIALVLFASVSLLASAQDTEEKKSTTGGMQYIFGKGNKLRLSGFGAPITELSFINDRPVLSNGGGGALLINQKFFIGAYSLSTVTGISDFVWENNQSIYGSTPVFVQVGSWAGYNFNPHKALHFTASAKLGYAQIFDVRYHNSNNWNSSQNYISSGSFTATPQIEAEVNLFKWMKLNVGAGYRWVANNSLGGNTTSSPVFSGTLMFGWFK